MSTTTNLSKNIKKKKSENETNQIFKKNTLFLKDFKNSVAAAGADINKMRQIVGECTLSCLVCILKGGWHYLRKSL